MKKHIVTIAIIFFIGNYANAQMNTPSVPNVSITGEHAFIDASDYGSNWPTNEAKGLIYPQTDLTQWVFKTELLGALFLSAYDGMVVYNTGTGSTLATVAFGGLGQPEKADNGVQTSVTPGFYYFYNPTRLDEFLNPIISDTVGFGKWLPIGSAGTGTVAPVKSYNSSTETATGISIDGKALYAMTGTFTTLGINALITVTKPLGMTGYYKMTTYKDGITFRSDISKFDMDPLVLIDNVTTGSGLFTEVYPAGTYTYSLEYFKS